MYYFFDAYNNKHTNPYDVSVYKERNYIAEWMKCIQAFCMYCTIYINVLPEANLRSA